MVLKGLTFDNWLIWLFQSQAIELKIVFYWSMCEPVDCHTGQKFWLNWPMANSAKAVILYDHHWWWWHHCLLCKALLIMWLMPVISYVAQILAYFPHWCT